LAKTTTEELAKRRKLLVEFFNTAPIKKTFGMELSYDDEGSAVFEMPYNSGLDHFLGGIHGGVISTLLDVAGWFTAAAYYDCWIATVDLNVKLLLWAEKEHLTARGRILRTGSKISAAEMEVRGEDGRLIATGSGTFFVTDQPLETRTADKS